MNLNELLPEHIRQVDEIIFKYMPEKTGYYKTVAEAMDYSLRAGGKRLRPMIIYEVCRMFLERDMDETEAYKRAEEIAGPFMAALEMIHTYSLVHDDLPAMDNDTLRRGKPTTWAVYGEGMAVLTGDALLNYAFETAIRAVEEDMSPEDMLKRVRAIRVLADKAGINGMIGGQVADVEAEKKDIRLDEERLLYIHENKTGALLQAAFVIGGILGGADKSEQEKLSEAALAIGVAFQIQDDILDVCGDEALLGKNIGSDEESGKETYVTLFGMERAKADVAALSEKAIGILKGMKVKSGFLMELTESLINRRY